MIRRTAAVLAACLASACLGSPEPENVVFYDLDTRPAPWVGDRSPARVVVREFAASQSLDRDGIRYLRSDHEGGYWVNHRWSAPVAALVREAAVRDLEVSGLFAAVLHADGGGVADLAVGAEVLRFQERDRADGWYAEVELSVEALRVRDGAVLYHRRLAAEERCDSATVRDVVVALSRALGRLFEEVRRDLAAAAGGSGA